MASQDPKCIILVSNISPKASEKALADFFSFCGKIKSLTMRKNVDNGDLSAVIVFENESGAQTGLLLSNAMLVDKPIVVSPLEAVPVQVKQYETSASYIPRAAPTSTTSSSNDISPPVELGAPSTSSAPAVSAQAANLEISEMPYDDITVRPELEDKSASAVVSNVLANGYVLEENAAAKAKELDEQNSLLASISAKAEQLDKEYAISKNLADAGTEISNTWKELDSTYHISETTVKVGQSLSNAIQDIGQGLAVSFNQAQESPTGHNLMQSLTNAWSSFSLWTSNLGNSNAQQKQPQQGQQQQQQKQGQQQQQQQQKLPQAQPIVNPRLANDNLLINEELNAEVAAPSRYAPPLASLLPPDEYNLPPPAVEAQPPVVSEKPIDFENDDLLLADEIELENLSMEEEAALANLNIDDDGFLPVEGSNVIDDLNLL